MRSRASGRAGRRRRPVAVAGPILWALALWAAPAWPAATLFGLVSTGEIHASVDGGLTWQVRGTLSVPDATALVAVASASDLLLVTTAGTVYGSADGGLSWQVVGFVPAGDVVDLTLRPDGDPVVVTRNGMICTSADAGAGWTVLASLPATGLTGITLLPPDQLLALAETGEVYGSSDGGLSWTVRAALPLGDGVAIRARSEDVFVLTGAGDVHRSRGGGFAFERSGTLSQVGMRSLAVTDGGLAAATREGEVAVSGDGVTWIRAGTVNQVWLTALASDLSPLVSVRPPGTGRGLRLGAPYPCPGPAGGTAFFPLRAERSATVRLELYDLRGRCLVSRPPERLDGPGDFVLPWRPGRLAAGVYLVRLLAGDGSADAVKWLVGR